MLALFLMMIIITIIMIVIIKVAVTTLSTMVTERIINISIDKREKMTTLT